MDRFKLRNGQVGAIEKKVEAVAIRQDACDEEKAWFSDIFKSLLGYL